MDAAAIDEAYRLEDDHWWFVGKRLIVGALLEDALGDPSLRLLDVGCGTGGVLAALKDRTRIIGVDRSPRALGYCRRRGVAELACSEAHRLPFGRGTFDGILLLDVLEHRRIAGAVLDVFDNEPLPPHHPLWRMDNVVVTPHISGPSTPDAIAPVFNDNLSRFLAGRPLRHVVDRRQGY